MITYNELRKINVNEHTERKGNLTYLSWAWAVDQLLQNDPGAVWEFPEPRVLADETVMVFCKVTAFGKTLPMQLPVMDNRNNAIKSPDARKISDATMRCLAKCIACFGIGLYIYAGEDLPEEDVVTIDPEPYIQRILNAATIDELKELFHESYTVFQRQTAALALINKAKDRRKTELTKKVEE